MVGHRTRFMTAMATVVEEGPLGLVMVGGVVMVMVKMEALEEEAGVQLVEAIAEGMGASEAEEEVVLPISIVNAQDRPTA